MTTDYTAERNAILAPLRPLPELPGGARLEEWVDLLLEAASLGHELSMWRIGRLRRLGSDLEFERVIAHNNLEDIMCEQKTIVNGALVVVGAGANVQPGIYLYLGNADEEEDGTDGGVRIRDIVTQAVQRLVPSDFDKATIIVSGSYADATLRQDIASGNVARGIPG